MIFLPYYLAVTPQERPQLPACPLPLVHIVYRIENGGHLSCSAPHDTLSEGLMGLSDCCCGALPHSERLLCAILCECERRKFSGVFVDSESSPCADRLSFFDRLGAQLSAQGKRLYLPLGIPAPSGILLVNTALSCGSLSEHLQAEKSRFRGRIALDFERMRTDSVLPCSLGHIRRLSADELAVLRRKYGMSVFYSRDLCTHYFTYTLDNETHFVLYDDAETIKSKIMIGKAEGVNTGFFMYPEVRDLLPQLFDLIQKADH